MSQYKRGRIWWYKFHFAGREINESSKSHSKTVAKVAEQERRRELEAGFHNLRQVRQQRIRRLNEVIEEYLVGYRLRYRSATFAEYALGHVSRLAGNYMIVDFDETMILRYQEDRLREKAASKTINEEVRFLLKMLGEPGELIRLRLKQKKQLKLGVDTQIGKAFDSDETVKLAGRARLSRSPHIYPAFMLARNAGLRDNEIKTLTWGQIDLKKRVLQVGKSKTPAGVGRTIPTNDELYAALCAHRAWYLKRFGAIHDDWYLFPWGKPMPSDPTRHVTSLKTAWKGVRRGARVQGRWHDNRHSLITELAEGGAGDETIMAIAGHVDRRMLRHYSHIRMEAKRNALDKVLAARNGHGKDGSEGS